MHTQIQAQIHSEKPEGTWMWVLIPGQYLTDHLAKYSDGDFIPGELRFNDGRTITADQRAKAHATIKDIADHFGYHPEDMKRLLKYWYVEMEGIELFSLAYCSVTTARLFINFLIDFAFEWDIPLKEPGGNRTDDISAYLYACLVRRKCCVCNDPAEPHHVDRVGMGRDRREIIHRDMLAMALCREHHNEVHVRGQDSFDKLHHVYGIAADDRVCNVYNLNT